MTETEKLAEMVTRVIEGDPWHGPNVMSLLEGVSHRVAASHPVPGGHSIWELVLHMTGWADEVRARLAGDEAGEPKAGDWPAVTEASPAAWTQAVAALVNSHATLAAAVRATGDSALAAAVRDRRNRAAGTGLSQCI
jgi:DinB superfamily